MGPARTGLFTCVSTCLPARNADTRAQRRIGMSHVHVTRRLPDRPHLDVPRREARELLADWKNGDPAALERLRALHPRLKRLTVEEVAATPARLADAQWVIAREYTYETWAELKRRIEMNAAAVAIHD